MRENIYKCDVSTEDGATRRSEGDERDARTPVGLREKRKEKKAKETKCQKRFFTESKTQRNEPVERHRVRCSVRLGFRSGTPIQVRNGRNFRNGTLRRGTCP
ncbi:unnamed protein product [Sphagnum troendelagicum]